MSPSPDWPGTANFPALPYRGAWTEKSVQLPFATGNGESAASTPKVFWGTGSPNGVLTGKPGDLAIQTDGVAGLVTWQKASGTNTNTGWSLLVSALITGQVFVDEFGAKGDGTTDDTAAIQAAENARAAGQTLKFTPGKTYLLGATLAANLLVIKSSGLVDFLGATLLYGGAGNLTTGSDGGALGILNVLASNVRLQGTVDGNSKVNFPLALKSQVANIDVDITIANVREPTTWCGISFAASADVTGVAISGRTTNVRGFLSRPACPISDVTDTIISHGDVSATLIGGNLTIGNATSAALVLGGSQFDAYLALLNTVGIMNVPKAHEGNTHWQDFIVHDLGCNVIETYGHQDSTGFFGLDGTHCYPAHLIKVGSTSAWYWDNSNSATTNPPNVRIQGMSHSANAAAQQGYGYIAGQWQLGSQKPAATASYTPDLSTGNDFVIPASGGALTVNAPTNVPVNPSGLGLTQIFSVTIQRLSGGALTTTWNAAYHLAGAWVDPSGANTQRSIWFRYDIGAGVAYEISRSAADVTV